MVKQIDDNGYQKFSATAPEDLVEMLRVEREKYAPILKKLKLD